jgi:exopolysaccharide biosynthesis protein
MARQCLCVMKCVQVDGEEDIGVGINMFELIELLMDMGVESAVNLDGGGSR